MGGAGGRAVAARGLPRGRESAPFSLEELAAAAAEHDDKCVYAELDAAGRLAAAGGGGAARLAARARVAPHPLAATALLDLADLADLADQHSPARTDEGVCRAGGGGGGAGAAGGRLRLRLRVAHALAPHAELLLWLAEPLLALVDMPFLTPRNILGTAGGAGYACHACGARFEQPNPLKLHLFLACRPPHRAALWRRALARLGGPRRSAFRPYAGPPSPPASPPGPAPGPAALDPAALEALAAAWGRAAGAGAPGGGHACVYCGKLYSRKYGLKIHIRTHTGYKPLRCRYCARAFGDPSNLNKHVRLHAGAAAGAAAGAGAAAAAGGHACAACGAVLARRRDLERHVRARHAAERGPPAPALLRDTARSVSPENGNT